LFRQCRWLGLCWWFGCGGRWFGRGGLCRVSKFRLTQICFAAVTEQWHYENSEHQTDIHFIDLPPPNPPALSMLTQDYLIAHPIKTVPAENVSENIEDQLKQTIKANRTVGADGSDSVDGSADGLGGKGDLGALVAGSGGTECLGCADALGGKGDPSELVAGSGGTDCSGGADGWGCAGGSGAVVGGLGDSGAVLGGLGGGIYAGSPNSD
jgi:hypothetical protein